MGETNKTAPTNKRNGEQQRKEGAIKSPFLFRTNGGKAKEGSVKDAGETRAKTFFFFFNPESKERRPFGSSGPN